MSSHIAGHYASLSATAIPLIRLNTDLDYPTSGELQIVTLEDPPPYYAISHAWKPGESPAVIQDGDQLRLSKNLTICIRRLQQLCHRDDPLSPTLRHIWIDNICINQANTLERSCQVALMKRVYSQSTRTVIWLGDPEFALIAAGWQLISKIYGIFKKKNSEAKVISDIPLRTYDEGRHLALGLPLLEDLRWKYLERLMSLRWYTRIRVIQEVVLSSRDPIILHGNNVHAWESLGWAAAWLRRSGYMRLP